MKKLMLCGLLVLSANSWADLKVAATFTILADIAKNIAGDRAIVVSITKPGAEIHDYEPTPRDFIKAQNSDLLISNGLNLERWFEKFAGNLGDIETVVASKGVVPILISAGEYQGKPNPHAWMSPSDGKKYVQNIAKAMMMKDPLNADYYLANSKKYQAKLDEVSNLVKKELAAVPEKQRFLVTSEGAFSYLVRDYGWREAYLWPVNAERQGTPKQVANLIKKVRANKIPVVFSESTISDKPAKQVAKESGAIYGGVLYVDSLSTPSGKVPTYLDLLKVTTNTIIEGFKSKE